MPEGDVRPRRRGASSFILFLAFLLLIRPPYVAQIPIVASVYDFGRPVVVVASIVVLILGMSLEAKLPYGWLGVFGLAMIFTLSTALAGFGTEGMGETLSVVGLSTLMLIGIRSGGRQFLGPLRFVLELLLYLNLLTILLYPQGLFAVLYEGSHTGIPNWFLGHKNPLVRLAIPALCISLLCDYDRKPLPSIRTAVLTASTLASVWLVDSLNGVLGILLFAGLLIWMARRGRATPSLYAFLLVNGLFFVFIVIGRAQEVFSDVLAFLGKDLTFVGRTFIWDEALRLVGDRPLLGQGNASFAVHAKNALGTRAAHPHNFVLYQLVRGGVVALALAIALLLRTARVLKRFGATLEAQALTAALGVLLIIGLTESLTETVLFFPLVMLGIYFRSVFVSGDSSVMDDRDSTAVVGGAA